MNDSEINKEFSQFEINMFESELSFEKVDDEELFEYRMAIDHGFPDYSKNSAHYYKTAKQTFGE